MRVTIIDEIFVWIKGSLSWIIPAISGTAARLSYESESKKLKRGVIITSFIIGCFVGYLIDILLTAQGITQIRGFATGAAGFLSKDIIKFVISKKAIIFDKLILGIGSMLDSIKRKDNGN